MGLKISTDQVNRSKFQRLNAFYRISRFKHHNSWSKTRTNLQSSNKIKQFVVARLLIYRYDGCFPNILTIRCMTFADCRLQTADCRLQTADHRPQTADCMRQQDCKLNETKNIVTKVASSSTLPCSEKYM